MKQQLVDFQDYENKDFIYKSIDVIFDEFGEEYPVDSVSKELVDTYDTPKFTLDSLEEVMKEVLKMRGSNIKVAYFMDLDKYVYKDKVYGYIRDILEEFGDECDAITVDSELDNYFGTPHFSFESLVKAIDEVKGYSKVIVRVPNDLLLKVNNFSSEEDISVEDGIIALLKSSLASKDGE